MADDLSTSTATDEVVDTSVDGDSASETTDDDVNLEDIEVDEADIASEDDDTDQADEEDSEGEDDESEDDATDEASEDDAEKAESELSDEEKQKRANNEAAQKRIQDRQARAQKIKADQAQYIADAAESADPIEIAVRQLQVDGYNNAVEAASNKLTNGYERALTDFPVLKTENPIIQAEIDQAIDAFQAMYVDIDGYGNPTGVRGDLYATLKAKADSIEKLTGIKAQRQEKSKTKEKSKVVTVPRRSPKTAKVDPDIEAFDEEAAR